MEDSGGSRLFEAVVIVELKEDKPEIIFQFPEKSTLGEGIGQVVPLFCFPESSNALSLKKRRETFSFILTGGDGSKQVGYCKRLFNGSTPRCYCILSFLDSFSLFSYILDVVEEREISGGCDSVICFLGSVLNQPVPQAGDVFTVSTFSDSNPNDLARYEFTLPLNNDFLLEYISFGDLFTSLGIPNVIKVFECLLLESRVVFVSKTLGKLSSCVSSALALLNPFQWQYVFIPILPSSLLSYCCAPMPFIVGVTESSLNEILSMPTEELLIVQIDQGKFLQIPEQNVVFTEEMRDFLRVSLNKISSSCNKEDKMFDLNVARCFVNFMYRLLGNYYKFMDKNGILDHEMFLECQPPQFESMTKILQDSQMWHGFLEEREIWKKKQILDSCVLIKEANSVWCVEDLSLTCCKCKKKFVSNGHTKNGKYYCHPCFEAKFSLLLEQKRLIETSSEKMKKVTKSFSKKVKNMAPPSMPMRANSTPDTNKIPPKKEEQQIHSGSEIRLKPKSQDKKQSFFDKASSISKSGRTRAATTFERLTHIKSQKLPLMDDSSSEICTTKKKKSKIRKCEKCKEKIEPNQLLNIGFHYWHNECRPCKRCKQPIRGNQVNTVNGEVYHTYCPPLRKWSRPDIVNK